MNFKIHTGTDGTWLQFRASNGKHAALRVEGLIDKQTSIIGDALRQWCADRQVEALTPPAPGNAASGEGGAVERSAWPTHCIHGNPISADKWCADCRAANLVDREVTEPAWLILQALHENVPEADRPMSWSDVNGDQEQRIRAAAVAAIEYVRAALSSMAPATRGDLLDWLLDRIDDAKARVETSRSVSPNSYGAGYDLGFHEALREALDQASKSSVALAQARKEDT